MRNAKSIKKVDIFLKRRKKMSYKVLLNQMKSIIANLPSGEKFLLKDIITDPPTRLGRTLYDAVESGEIPNVKYIGQESGSAAYEKL